MTTWLLAAFVLACRGQENDGVPKPQDPQEELRKENETLRAKLEEAERELVRLAREIYELRQQIKSGVPRETSRKPPDSISTPAVPPESGTVPDPVEEIEFGPDHSIVGEVRHIIADQGMLAISVGRKHGVQIGYRFEILREATGESRRIAVAKAVRFLGQAEDMTKLEVLEGDVREIKADDVAVALRRTKGVLAIPEGIRPVPKMEFRITGSAGQNFLIDYGVLDGAKASDRVFVYRGGNPIATLRLDVVQPDFSVGAVVQKEADPSQGDEVRIQKPPDATVGQISLNDSERGIIVNFGTRKGAKTGMTCDVRRSGRTVGKIVLTDAQTHHSYAKPAGDSKPDDFTVGDFVEVNP